MAPARANQPLACERPTSRLPRQLWWLLPAAAIAWLPWDLHALTTGPGIAELWSRLGTYLGGFAHPDLSAPMLQRSAGLAAETLAVALLGTALGLLLGYPLALLANRACMLGTDPHPSASGILRRGTLEAARLLLDLLRGVPDFLWALLLVPATGMGAGTGILAIALCNAGILGKILSEQWDQIAPARYDAVRAVGGCRMGAFFYGVQPLSARAMQSFLLMRMECTVRNASVIGVVGGGGLGAALWDEYTDGAMPRVATLLLALLTLTFAADWLANGLRSQLRLETNAPNQAQRNLRHPTTHRRWRAALAIAAALLWASWWLAPALQRTADELLRTDAQFLREFAFGIAIPDVRAETLAAVVRHSGVPLALGLLATLLALLLASALVYPGSIAFQLQAHRITGEQVGTLERLRRTSTVVLARLTALVLRGVPEVAWVLLLMVITGPGILPCVLAVSLHSAGVLHRVCTEAIDNLPYDQLEKVSNACRSQVFWYGALPRAWPEWRTYAFFQFEANVRIGIALGVVGAGGLGERMKANLDFRELATAGSFLWAMVILTVVIDRVSRALQLKRNRC